MPPHFRRVWRDNGLSIVLVVSFLATWLGQVLAGWDVYNDERRDEGRSAVSITEYLASSHFGEATFENWESEFLQMAAYVLFTVSSCVSVARLNQGARARSSWWTSMLVI